MRRLLITAGALALCACIADVQAADVSARKPKALLIMLDGARADAVAAARMPAVQSLRNGSWAPGYSGAWSLFGQNVPDARPSSAANHTAIFTAVNAAKSRVFNNGQTKDGDYAHWPTWLARVTAAVPGAKGLFIFSWGEGKQYPSSPNVQFIHDSDANNAKNLPNILAAPDAPDAIQAVTRKASTRLARATCTRSTRATRTLPARSPPSRDAPRSRMRTGSSW